MSHLQTYTFWQLADQYKIEIPIVQRDYAQGRSDAKSKDVRDKFLSDLFTALTDDTKPIELDFVYGKVKDDVFIPIDGQQRLTTLFLLHWYIAVRIKNIAFCNISFSYKIRISARDFCTALINSTDTFSIEDNLLLSEQIRGSSWFFLSWKKDPTVQAMLTMLDAIHEKCKKCADEQTWEKMIAPNYMLPTDNPTLTDLIAIIEEDNNKTEEVKAKLNQLRQKPPISFQFLNLEEFQLSDELYLKMNARGKELSDFENFKAWLIGYVEGLNKEHESKAGKKSNFEKIWCDEAIEKFSDKWKNKIDGSWTDLFWQFKDKDSKIDSQFIRFFIELGLLEFVVRNTKDDKDTIENIQYLTKKENYFDSTYFEKLNCFNSVSLDFIFQTLTMLIGNDKKLKNFSHVETYFEVVRIFNSLINNKITYPQRAYFYAFILFITDDKIANDKGKLFDWMRFIRNIVENTTIDSSTNFANAAKALFILKEFKEDILRNLVEGSCDKVPFFGTQIKAEKIKASLILNVENIDWRGEIIAAENHPLFKGDIEFLLPDGASSDFNIFVRRKEIAMELFNKDGVVIGKNTNLLGRVLLATGFDFDYRQELWLGGKNNQYWNGHLKDKYYSRFVLKAIDLLTEIEEEKYEEHFHAVLSEKDEIDKLAFWQQVLIRNPDLFQSYSSYGKVKKDWRGVNLYAQEKFNAKTNAILIENNRNELIYALIHDYHFCLSDGNCVKCEKFYAGDNISIRKEIKEDEPEILELVFQIDRITTNNNSNIVSYKFDEIDNLKQDFSLYFDSII